MLDDISRYRDVKRNEKCPCGSGKTFKKCCLKEYREAKKNVKKGSAIISSCSPLKPLQQEDKEIFLDFYQKLMVFSHQYRNNSDIIYIDNINENMSQFLTQERDYFYKHRDEVIDAFINKKNPSPEKIEILEGIREAILDNFILMSYSDESAVLMAFEGKLYNIQSLDSPFEDIFQKYTSYIGVKTALIAYKGYYVSDGLYSVFEISPELTIELNKIPYKQPKINYSKSKNMTILPLLNHFSISTSFKDFEKMEDILLNKISDVFAEGFLELFEEDYLEKTYIVPAFYRSTDLAEELNNKEGDQKFSIMIGGTPISSYERGNRGKIISCEIMNTYYQQKPLKESASKSVYANIQKNKNKFFNKLARQSSFYTMISMVNIDIENIDKYEEFLEKFNTREYRGNLMIGVINLFGELSDEYNLDISPVYLDCGLDLDSIYEEIDEFRDFIKTTAPSAKNLASYSLMKG